MSMRNLINRYRLNRLTAKATENCPKGKHHFSWSEYIRGATYNEVEKQYESGFYAVKRHCHFCEHEQVEQLPTVLFSQSYA